MPCGSIGENVTRSSQLAARVHLRRRYPVINSGTPSICIDDVNIIHHHACTVLTSCTMSTLYPDQRARVRERQRGQKLHARELFYIRNMLQQAGATDHLLPPTVLYHLYFRRFTTPNTSPTFLHSTPPCYSRNVFRFPRQGDKQSSESCWTLQWQILQKFNCHQNSLSYFFT